jgi:uncharacterized protein YraI
MKRFGIIGALFLLNLLVSAHPFPAQAQSDGAWVGEYFNNPGLSGSPALVRADTAINFTWGQGSPDAVLASDRFSVRWTRGLYFPGGTYRFTVRSDDGVRIYVDNQIILDAWYDHAPDPALSVDVLLTAGQHALRVEYYENSGEALISVNWQLIASQATAPWNAEYYNNTSLAGPPAVQRAEQVIDYNWGLASPFPGQINADNFGVRWTGSPYFAAGTYTFTIYADDGARLWVDNQLVIDAWYDSGFTPPYTAILMLGQGTHALRVEYYEHLEAAAIRVEWTPAGGLLPTPIIPTPVPAPVTSGATLSGSWEASYFNTAGLDGAPVYTTSIPGLALNLIWNSGSPAASVPADYFSARFTRRVTFANSPLRFVLRADDGLRFYVDGTLFLDEWHTSSGDYFYVDYTPLPGEHTLTVEYYEATGLASLHFYWVYPYPARPPIGVTASVNANLLNVRTGPGVSYPVLGRISHGNVVAVTGRSTVDPRWVRINMGTIEGWINGTWTTMQGNQLAIPDVSSGEDTMALPFGTPTGLQVRATGNLNIRSGPGIGYASLGYLTTGSTADVVGRSADGAWWEINFASGRGWVSGAYLQKEGNLYASVPITG